MVGVRDQDLFFSLFHFLLWLLSLSVDLKRAILVVAASNSVAATAKRKAELVEWIPKSRKHTTRSANNARNDNHKHCNDAVVINS